MTRLLRAVATVALLSFGSGILVAQGALAELGLTETTARNFVLDEIKSASGHRGAGIAVAGTRAFLKLPASARGPAATALFTWAKAYVSSPAFKASYDSYRAGVVPQGSPASPPSVEETLKQQADEQRAGIEAMKKNLAASGLPPAEQAKILAAAEQAQAQTTSPEAIAMMRKALEAERAEKIAAAARSRTRGEEQAPTDPRVLFARRLREFLTATTDVNFKARTLSLTGGPDGIEFLDKADRQRHWIWQEAAIVGPEATAAARAAAAAWLKELEP